MRRYTPYKMPTPHCFHFTYIKVATREVCHASIPAYGYIQACKMLADKAKSQGIEIVICS